MTIGIRRTLTPEVPNTNQIVVWEVYVNGKYITCGNKKEALKAVKRFMVE